MERRAPYVVGRLGDAGRQWHKEHKKGSGRGTSESKYIGMGVGVQRLEDTKVSRDLGHKREGRAYPHKDVGVETGAEGALGRTNS
ncbi:hypothetical protein RF55_21446 [Lasius niger]|uniref:Uncharacterized protein n=1 Tax=Lasius niger TaxID=67767 RepID=A0A0J7JXU0_LASNI|nr:hypothetical protein RF55_21446 [Lasius niger]